MKLVARKGLDEEEVTLLPEDAEDMVSACHFTLLAFEHRKLFYALPLITPPWLMHHVTASAQCAGLVFVNSTDSVLVARLQPHRAW